MIGRASNLKDEMQCSDDDNSQGWADDDEEDQYEYIGSEDEEDGGTVDENSDNDKVESALKGFRFDGKLMEILNDPNCRNIYAVYRGLSEICQIDVDRFDFGVLYSEKKIYIKILFLP